MTDDEILDADLTDDRAQYQAFVYPGADAFRRIVHDWYVSKFGHEPALQNFHFAYQRVLVERHQWKTLRNALERWPTEGMIDTRPPVQPPIVIDVPPGPGGGPIGIDVGTGTARMIRVTTDTDGPFAPRMMSDRANAWISGSHVYVFGGSRATGGPLFFQVDLRDDRVLPLGPKVSYGGETEFWSWTPNGLLMIAEGPRLHRVNPFRNEEDEVVLDISDRHPGCTLHQWHSSSDGQTHSATVKDASYRKIGTVCLCRGNYKWFPADGVLDESQCSNDWLLIKQRGDDNLLVNLRTGAETWITNAQGALGHSDIGLDFAVGENDQIGACVRMDFANPIAGPVPLFQTWGMGYVSVRGGKCLWTNDTHLSLAALDGSGVTPLREHGARLDPSASDYYDRRPKANLDHTGKVAILMVDGVIYLLVLP